MSGTGEIPSDVDRAGRTFGRDGVGAGCGDRAAGVWMNRGVAGGGVDEVVAADVVVVGTGLAGLSVALGLSGHRVQLLTKGRVGRDGATPLAQGGVAAAVGPDDAPRLHAADTLAAGAGLADEEMARLLARQGPKAIARLAALGVPFDRLPDGAWALGREAAHRRARILHARDATGAAIARALAAAVADLEGVEIRERTFAEELVVERGRIAGLTARRPDGGRTLLLAPAVVLACGGSGRLFLRTTNPAEATGDGLALAVRAGARLTDLEFVQFHPTALAVGDDPMPLLTEALRGAGATLIDERGRRFMAAVHPAAELAPRDVVTRAVHERLAAGGTVFLDARRAVGSDLPRRFPTVYELCRRHGLDPRRQPVPVAPAAHYQMGGVEVDRHGRSSLPGLWACGEVAATGVHGANRLASNSLLEAAVFGQQVASDLERALRAGLAPPLAAAGLARRPSPFRAVCGSGEAAEAEQVEAVRRLMWEGVGIVRHPAGMAKALRRLEELARNLPPGPGEARNLLTVALIVTRAATARLESRGAHCRTDYPRTDPAWARRLVVTAQPDAAAPVGLRLSVRGAPPATAAMEATG